MSEVGGLVDDYLQLHARLRPVDATFMGLGGNDHRLPPVEVEAERAKLEDLLRRVENTPIPGTPGERLDYKLLLSQLRVSLEESRVRPRQFNPAWYTGEAAFSLISLLLPSDPERDVEDFKARLNAIPEFLASGTRMLRGRNIPADWVERARREAHALHRLLTRGLPHHPWHGELVRDPAERAAKAALSFADELQAGDADPACGEPYLAFLMREAHALPYSPAEAERLAEEAFFTLRGELEREANHLDPTSSWREQLAALEGQHPPLERVRATYEEWHGRAMRAAEPLLTPAGEYGLSFEWLPQWAREVAGDLYFLFYRSPPPLRAGRGSTYWVFPPGDDVSAYLRSQNEPFVKLVHAVHHGSIGHHTHNARARQAASRLARLGGTDCASGIAFLSAGTSVEGWACYAEDLLAEAPDFYSPGERLLLRQFELRNAACCLADIRLHTGKWTLDEMRAFYRDEVGFAPGRIWAETTRNSIFPATRLMYWLGTRAVKELRAELNLPPKTFHDRFLAHGHAPVSWIADELRRAHVTSEGAA